MQSKQFLSLDYNARRRYLEKLRVDGEILPDPYSIGPRNWLNDVERWPDVEFGDIYTYLIETEGAFTKEKLKAYKSLDAYNYFYNGHVRTVYYHEGASKKFGVFKSMVNPSQKNPDMSHEAWVVVETNSGTIRTAHCTCMAG